MGPLTPILAQTSFVEALHLRCLDLLICHLWLYQFTDRLPAPRADVTQQAALHPSIPPSPPPSAQHITQVSDSAQISGTPRCSICSLKFSPSFPLPFLFLIGIAIVWGFSLALTLPLLL